MQTALSDVLTDSRSLYTMDNKEMEEFRAKLLLLQSELQEQEKACKQDSGTVELDQSRVGRLSRMDAMQAQQMALEDSRRRQERLMKIKGALLRIESGEYGDCFICGEEIDVRRMVVDPTNTRCIHCVGK